MKNKKFFTIICLIIFLIKGSSFGDEFKTEATKIQILEKGNIIKALEGVKVSSSDGITIEGQESFFNKIDSYLEVYGDVFFNDKVNNITLKSNKIIYDKKNEIITSEGNVEYLDKIKNVSLKSDKTIYDIKRNIISSKGNMRYNDDDKNIFLKSDKINYNREKQIITSEGNVEYLDSIKNIFIQADKIEYDRNNILIRSFGKTFADIYNKYIYEGRDLIINEKKNIIQSKFKSKLRDQLNNKFSMANFKFKTLEKVITANEITFVDSEKNKYNLNSGIIDLSKNEVIGKDLYLEFNKSLFGDSRNDPRLKGNAITNNDDESVIYKGVFTTCKKKSEDKCPPWQISAEKVTHKKKEKIIEYKNAWLRIYDKPIVYFPYFFHPDPSVQRQSGFLLPTISNSNVNGIGFQLPYYKVIADNKDLTFSPRLYSNNNILFQTEYRQANKSSDFITDFSFNRKDSDTKTHFFSNLSGSNEDFEYKINIETVSNSNYLKVNNIKSPIIKDINTLNSYIIFEKFEEKTSLEGSFEVIEDLTKKDSDKYEYIFPNYRFTNNINNYFEFYSSGYQKQYNTNVNELNIINDIIYKNDTHISSNGFVNNITTLIRNVNSDADNSTSYKNGSDNKLLGSIFFDTSIPMIKNDDILEPKFSLRYSPNKTKNYTNLDNMIDYNSIFSLDRFAQNDMVESDFSLTLGAKYIKRDKNKNNLLDISIANNIRFSEDNDLPKYQNFNEKRSDIVGKLNFKPSKYFDLEYDFSLNNSLKHSNYNLVKTSFNLNNFVTSFEFLEEDNNIGEKSFIKNTSVLQIDEQNFLTFKTNKDIDKDLTEYYNLIYEYRNDCLSASLEYNKQYYDDIDLKPETNLFFYIKLIPFGTVLNPNTNQ